MKIIKLIIIVLILIVSNITILSNSNTSESYNTSSNTTNESFSTNIQLTINDNLYPQHVEPTLTVGPNNELFVGYKEANTPTGGGVNVSFIRSLDGGIAWSTPSLMPSNVSSTRSESDPWLNYYNNTIYYSYLDYTSDLSSSQVTMARSTDKGNSWITSKASDNSLFADKEVFIISPNGTIFLVYDDVNSVTSLGLVKLSKSIDGGKTFTDTTSINNNINDYIVGPYPALSSNSTLIVTWAKFIDSNNYFGDVYYDHSNNGGLTFVQNTKLNPTTNYVWFNNGKATIPVIKFDSQDRMYILWAEYSNVSLWKVYFRYSDDLGLQWSNKIVVDETAGTDQWEPDLAIDSNNNLHLAWLEEMNNQYRPYYREISFSGTSRSTITKGPIIPIASSYTSASFPRPGDYLTIRVDSNNIPQVVWTDGRLSKMDIFYSHLIQSTTTTTSNSSLTSTSNKSSSGFEYLYVLIAFIILLPTIRKGKRMM